MSGGLFDLSGRVAIVTGTSRGLGQYLARALADWRHRLAQDLFAETALREERFRRRDARLEEKCFEKRKEPQVRRARLRHFSGER